MANLDYAPQIITEFIYGLVRRGLLITDVVKSNCNCFLNDNIEVGIINLWPTAPVCSTTASQVDFDAMLNRS